MVSTDNILKYHKEPHSQLWGIGEQGRMVNIQGL